MRTFRFLRAVATWVASTVIAVLLLGPGGNAAYDYYRSEGWNPNASVAAVMAFALELAGAAWFHWIGGGLIGFAMGVWSDVIFRPRTRSKPSNILASLADLGWGIKPTTEILQFEVSGRALPPMAQSAELFLSIDKKFKLFLQNVENLDGLRHLSSSKMLEAVEINAGEFTDISDLSSFVSLSRLVISQVPLNTNGFVDSSPLSSLTGLSELHLGNTRITDARFLLKLTSLKKLWIGNTLISDISPIIALEKLEELDVRGSRVTTLDPLASLRSLSSLHVGANQVGSIGSLSRNSSLKSLHMILDENVVDVSPVGHLTQIETLWIWGPKEFVDISPLRSLTRLRRFTIAEIGFASLLQIKGLDSLRDMVDLEVVTLGGLQIGNLEFIENNKFIVELNLNKIPINSIEPIRGLIGVKTLSMIDLPIIDITPLLDLPNLSQLTIGRVPARTDVVEVLKRRGVNVNSF